MVTLLENRKLPLEGRRRNFHKFAGGTFLSKEAGKGRRWEVERGGFARGRKRRY